MALNYYLTDIKDHRQVCFLYRSVKDIVNSGKSLEWHKCNGWYEYNPEDGDVISHLALQEEAPLLWRTKPITDTIIWACMAVGIGHIKNDVLADRFYHRYITVCAVIQPSVARLFTRKDVHSHIGLRTNVTSISNAQWVKRFFLSIDHIE